MSDKDTSHEPLNLKNQKELDKFLKNGGRKGALSNFNTVLKRAAKGKK